MTSKIYLEPGLSIKNLSEKCDTNRSYLSQIIHEKYQLSFNNFINKYRIEEARRLLMEPGNEIPLKALHERLGFSSYTRFYEAFKKYTGVTPSFFLTTIKEL
ncbi:MAG TPA: AraC family transcriptional regulator [Ignavibacteria bacterium]|nr:AraC family transcriptional regulator [Ignavibacteria bacterium]